MGDLPVALSPDPVEERKSKNHVYNFRDALISDSPIYAPAGQPKGNQLSTNGFVASTTATRPYIQYYLGDANGQDVDFAPSRAQDGTYDFTWYNAQTKKWGLSGVFLRVGGFAALGAFLAGCRFFRGMRIKS